MQFRRSNYASPNVNSSEQHPNKRTRARDATAKLVTSRNRHPLAPVTSLNERFDQDVSLQQTNVTTRYLMPFALNRRVL